MELSTPRKPTPEELRELADYLRRPDEVAADDIPGFIQGACIAVFDDYISDGPGYRGKVMMVMWSGGPGMYEVYSWRAGQIRHERQEDGCG